MWDLPRPGLEPVFPALAGRFLTTAPPGKSQRCFFQAGAACMAEAKSCHTASPLGVLTLSPFWQCDLRPFQAFFSVKQLSVSRFPFPHQPPLYMSVQPRPHGYLTSLSLTFLKILVFPFLKK